MNLAVLTSSRADYGIYRPFLSKVKSDSNFKVTLICFGMHLSKKHGYTKKEILKDNFFDDIHYVNGMPKKDHNNHISRGYGNLIINFAKYWTNYKFDLVFALGDRFEMSAAIQSTIPYEIKIAHIHGGEITKGAIDNIYRDQISLASKLHFVSTEKYAKRLKNILGSSSNIYNIGSISLSEIEKVSIPSRDVFNREFNIPNRKFILVTFHPETIDSFKNEEYIKVIEKSLKKILTKIQLVITLPNADTMGSLYIDLFHKMKNNYSNEISLIKNFGKINYFAAMKYSELLLGNSSSGIIEAASFNKYVINVGNRQLGRLRSPNIIDVEFNSEKIIQSVEEKIAKKYRGKNKYYRKDTVNRMIKILKENEL